MKTVQYDLRIIHRKKVAIGAINRKEIDRILRDMITSGEALNMEGGEVVGIVVEEKGSGIVRETVITAPIFARKMRTA